MLIMSRFYLRAFQKNLHWVQKNLGRLEESDPDQLYEFQTSPEKAVASASISKNWTESQWASKRESLRIQENVLSNASNRSQSRIIFRDFREHARASKNHQETGQLGSIFGQNIQQSSRIRATSERFMRCLWSKSMRGMEGCLRMNSRVSAKNIWGREERESRFECRRRRTVSIEPTDSDRFFFSESFSEGRCGDNEIVESVEKRRWLNDVGQSSNVTSLLESLLVRNGGRYLISQLFPFQRIYFTHFHLLLPILSLRLEFDWNWFGSHSSFSSLYT